MTGMPSRIAAALLAMNLFLPAASAGATYPGGGGAHTVPPKLIRAEEMAPPVPVTEFVPEDFACRFPLRIEEGKSPAIAVELTGEAYRCLTRPDVGDLRVFDGDGKPLPFIIDEPLASAPPPSSWREVPLFPLAGFAGEEPEATPGIRITTRPDGTIVDIRTGRGRKDRDKPGAYILDLGTATGGAPRELRLEWRNEDAILIEATVEQSADLLVWRPAGKAVLARMRIGDHGIDRNRIDLPAPVSRYLRLSWPDGKQGPVLQGAWVRVTSQTTPPPLRWTRPSVVKEEAARGRKRIFLFDSEGTFPVTGLRVRLPRPGSLAALHIASTERPGGPWRSRYRGVFYRLSMDEREVHSDQVSITRTSDRYWRITLIDSFSLGDEPPGLELGWRPQRIRFVASGRPPLFLACGNPRITPLSPAFVNSLRQSIFGSLSSRMIGTASLGGPQALGGPEPAPPPSTPLPWRQWLLWVVLLGGVLVVGFMVRNLWREMRAKP